MIDTIFDHQNNQENILSSSQLSSSSTKNTDGLPAFDFRGVSLSRSSKEQLARIYEAVRSEGDAASERMNLQNLLRDNGFDPVRGIYVPTAHDVYLVGKLPTVSRQLAVTRATSSSIQPFGAALFTNALLIPEGYGTATFDPAKAPAPKLRLTNSGFLLVTIEYDCETKDEFEEILSWTRSADRTGKNNKSPFAAVDRELCRLKDYRGYSIVLSGSRSLHFHCLFSTVHLKNAPYDASAGYRYKTFRNAAALLENAHQKYWDHTNSVFKSILKPSIEHDSQLRQATQWRRSPWGIRKLDKDSPILGLKKGTQVPQIVIRENIRTRAASRSQDYLVPSSFSVADPVSLAPSPKRQNQNIVVPVSSRLISLLQEECRAEWGEYPMPVEVRERDGDWVIRFRNHSNDKTPSTFVGGQHRRLIVAGKNDFGKKQFYLPDHMTANETIDHLQHRIGNASIQSAQPVAPYSKPTNNQPTSKWLDVPVLDDFSDKFRRHFAEPLSDKTSQEIKQTYRDKLWHPLFQTRDLSDKIVVMSGEGIGKTSTLLPLLAGEARDEALDHNDNIQRFAGFAFRSHDQARRKAEEFRKDGYSVVVWRSFWDHYKEACEIEKQKIIARDQFTDTSPRAVLTKIHNEQPSVFRQLEQVRKNIWNNPAKFTAYSTILIMTHRTVQTWDAGTLTRAWHHPDFDPFGSVQDHNNLRDRIKLSRVVLDEPEADDFLYVIPELTYDCLKTMQNRKKDWRNQPRHERLSFYRRLKGNKEIVGNQGRDFESFDELMRVDLTTLDLLQVDFDKTPFGYDSSKSGIYRGTHSDKYYIGSKPWLFGADRHVTLLTTESFVTDAVVGATKRFRHRGGKSGLPFRLPLDHVPGIYPIKIPTFIDKRARKEGVTALAQEITGSNANAIVISDMVRNVPEVMTFQGMKGVNGLEANDVYIVVTCLSPARYAELNVIGQWLELPNVVEKYYQDQINQAVGRNRGFRQSSSRETNTVLITSSRLWKNVLSGLSNCAPRVQLYEIIDKPW